MQIKPQQKNNIKNLFKNCQKVNVGMVDFNAKIDKERIEDIIGDYEPGEQNERYDILVQLWNEENLVVTNICFPLQERYLYTWKRPEDNEENMKKESNRLNKN